MKKILQKILGLLIVTTISFGFAQGKIWTKNSKTTDSNTLSKFHLKASQVQTFTFNANSLNQRIQLAPVRGVTKNSSNTIIDIPSINGELEQFRIYEAPIFSSDLAAQYPNIKSYVGYSIEDPKTRLSMSVSPQGVQTMISYVDKETVFMMPVSHGSTDYILYSKSSRGDYDSEFVCSTIEEVIESSKNRTNEFQRDADDQTLRSYRLALSVNGEYTTYHGGTVAGALAAMNATMTRVNAVFETDMAITFTLIDAPQLIFTNAATDPYSGNLGAWNAELANTLDANLADGDYDIGHMFGATGGGGNAGCIGCVCENGTVAAGNHKGSGITSPADGIPETDTFDIDYVAHEIGHQMGANHTWSFNVEGVGVNVEPGSGTTIMGYAGITGANNVELHSDPYFHYASINQILINVNSGPNQCAVTTAIANNPPAADAGQNHTIPNGTAYVLRGAATDADGTDMLTYCWEQNDNGITTNTSFGPTSTSGAQTRSLSPTASPNRYIPNLNRVLNGQLTETNPTVGSDWETVSTVARNLTWALTVRDREPTATGLNGQSSFDLTTITVDGTAGPFTVTSQTSNVTWDAGSTQTVTWDVAGTDTGAVNTPTVNILLSTDGGQTFPFTIATNVPNDGTHDVTVPSTGGDSSTVRIIVEGNNNIFYAVNSTNFTIQESEFVISVSNPTIDVCSPADAIYNGTYNTFLGFSGTTNLSTTGLPAGATAVINPTSVSTDGTAFTVTITGTGNLAEGSYPFTIQGVSGAITKTANVTLNVFSSTLNTITLASPTNGAIDVPSDGNLTWVADANAQNYLVEVASDPGFVTIVESATVQTTTYTTTALVANTQYFWRVTASNQCATANPSSVFSFTTANISCDSFSATDLPQVISDGAGGSSYTSTINVAGNFPITDVNVTIDITHTWNADLDITLTSPNGTVVELTSDNGGTAGQNYTATVFDQEAVASITTGSSPFTGTFIPEGDLSTIYGEMSGGDWILTVVDDAGQDGGNWNSFDLELCVQGTLSVDDFENSISGFYIYPNPNKGNFNVVLNNPLSESITISVYDIRGRKIHNQMYVSDSSFNQVINLENAQAGVYLVTVDNGLQKTTKRIIIE